MSKVHAQIRKEQLQDAITEAKRFIKRAQETILTIDDGTFESSFNSNELAAAKRAALDLKIALNPINKKIELNAKVKKKTIPEVQDILDEI